MGGNGGVDAQCSHSFAITAFGGRKAKKSLFCGRTAGQGARYGNMRSSTSGKAVRPSKHQMKQCNVFETVRSCHKTKPYLGVVYYF